jgi:hypothetical protein
MQTAPATSQKTPKVANGDFLSAHEPSSGPEKGSKTIGSSATSKNTGPSAVRQALPETSSVVAN